VRAPQRFDTISLQQYDLSVDILLVQREFELESCAFGDPALGVLELANADQLSFATIVIN
jgi:hypothetical protein